MANLTCSVTSISDLLDKADKNLLNITTAMASCPDICSLAWGRGNPDLSGIGANISYIIQAVLTVLCGPVVGLVYAFRHRLELDNRTQDRLLEVTYTFIETSIQFNVPVGIAAAIRMSQVAPFFEQFFLLCLLGMQMVSLAAVAPTALSFDKQHRQSSPILYGCGIQIILACVLLALQLTNFSWTLSNELIKGCKNYSGGLLFLQGQQKFSVIRDQRVVALYVPIVLVIGLVSVTIWRLRPREVIKSYLIKAVLPSAVSSSAVLSSVLSSAVLPYTGFAVGWMIYEIYQLEVMRNNLKVNTGADFQDDQWGFGQILAVSLWIPLCLKVVYYVASFAVNARFNELAKPW